MNFERIEKSSWSNNLCVIYEKLGSTAEVQDSIVPILNLKMNWRKLYPNLIFTAVDGKFT